MGNIKKIFKNKIVIEIAVIFVLICILLPVYDRYVFSRVLLNSDDAYEFMVTFDFLNGNTFLNDWLLGGYNFLTTDLLYMAVGVVARGLSYKAATLAYSVNYLCLIIAGWLLLRAGIRENRKLLQYGIIYAIMVVLPGINCAYNVRYHTGSVIWCMIALFTADHYRSLETETSSEAPKKPWKTSLLLMIIFFCMVMACEGDTLPVLIFVVPVLGAYFISVLRENKLQFNSDLRITCSVLGGAATGMILQKLFFVIGGARKPDQMVGLYFISLEDLPDSFLQYFTEILQLSNGYVFHQWMYKLHAVGALVKMINLCFTISVFTIAVYVIFSYFKRKDIDYICFILSAGILTISFMLIFTTMPSFASRYYAYFPVLFCVLFLRFIYMRIHLLPSISRILIISVLVFTSLFNLTYYNIRDFKNSQYSIQSDYYELSSWLIDNGLTCGYASYWNSTVNMLYSEGVVDVFQVHKTPDGKAIGPYYWLCKSKWFDKPANFVVFDSKNDTIDAVLIKKVFGSPVEIENCGRFTVYIYDHDISRDLKNREVPKELNCD